ncbi:MAG: glutamate--tRNA ligase [Candidatus Omnitrophica bacterium]|nr:glutamate--tRNA ligase [Candidatus Omnitrophota bacterium]
MFKTRFAPSPTGFLHIGGARTCLFSWLYARANGGTFVLRIEDTDTGRSKKEYLDEIIESIRWLGMDWDELYHQSDRFDMYRQYARQLIEEGKACEKEGAIFFKYEFSQIEIDDLIRGNIIFNELPKKEEVIIKSDGSPTYNFSCVIDDALGGITCVVRGEDHIPNTPKQILMYQALGFGVPVFAHVPLILSPEGGRLSKRFGATSIREYRNMGYLADALVNYLILLGWSPGENREIISLAEAQKYFDISRVNKSRAVFSLDKLNWLNAEYVKQYDKDRLGDVVIDFLRAKDFLPESYDKGYIIKVMALFEGRITTLQDIIDRAYFCFCDDYGYDEDTREILKKDYSGQILVLKDTLSQLTDFGCAAIEKEFRAVCERVGLKVRELVHPVRVALTGKKVGPGLFEAMEVLGKEKVIERLTKLISFWKEEGQE